ncbi:hypothetical protein NITGR_520021 [Nitrospina gracilis 3/211]|uniref:Motility protein n=1 Tax=Nitrospina gracilis (strain 3/211) TaxID=1266370 RepID=M1YZ25_NITG3|nr:hypothetical protein [Nitrospina sp. Nb-3]MCF8723860.1 hypothetical protein [Nitrospina sp. Nb-3]CCQ90979.1 hypothetical protein NITGR_520021 [Nitrospina gracilis 3/211]
MVDSVSTSTAASTAPQAVQTSAEALQLALKATEAQSQALINLLHLSVGGSQNSSTGSLIDLIV